MSSKPKVVELQAASAQPPSEETRAEDLFNKQKAYFGSDATKTYEGRNVARTAGTISRLHRQDAGHSCHRNGKRETETRKKA